MPCVSNVVIVVGIPHEEYIVPLGDHLAVRSHGLSSLILEYHAYFSLTESQSHHVYDMVERHLEGDVDHVMGVGSRQDIVACRVVSEEIHRELQITLI